MARVALAFLLVCAAAGAAHAQEVDGFPAETHVNKQAYTLLGTGVHSGDDGAPLYKMALYVEEDEARRAFPALVVRAGGHSHAALVGGDHASGFVVWGHFGKMAVLRAPHGLDAKTLQAELRAGFDESLPARSDPELQDAAAKLIGLFNRSLTVGQEILIRTDDAGHIYLDVAGERTDGPQSPKLARALWEVWLGEKAADPKLRRGLVDRIDLLGK
ncbi:MAG TPA: chalcone isomerase family protein [Polyangia bacterium]|jgi:hypothetical protein